MTTTTQAAAPVAFRVEERAGAVLGVPGRFYPFHATSADATVFRSQTWKSESRPYPGYGPRALIRAEVRFDDQCANGHQTFAITGEIYRPGARDVDACGCIHDDIAKAFPELAPLIRWHLVSTDGPMHYASNAVYLAGDRDHNGMRAGESRQIRNGRTGELAWTLEAVNAPGVAISSTPTGDGYRTAVTVPLFILDKSADGDEIALPPVPALQWVPMLRKGEGKARDLAAARRAAAWPDATDKELMQEPAALRAALAARLPRLLEQFRCDMEAAGFFWAPADYVAPRA